MQNKNANSCSGYDRSEAGGDIRKVRICTVDRFRLCNDEDNLLGPDA